jgi:hypothetical protein
MAMLAVQQVTPKPKFFQFNEVMTSKLTELPTKSSLQPLTQLCIENGVFVLWIFFSGSSSEFETKQSRNCRIDAISGPRLIRYLTIF